MPATSRVQMSRTYAPQPISYIEDRGAMGGYSAFEKLTECKTKPYIQDGKLFVPSFKRACVKAWADNPSDTTTIDETIIGQISQYINTSLDNTNFGLINQFRKVFTDRYKTYGDIPAHDPSISVSDPDPVNPNKKYGEGSDFDKFLKSLASIGGFVADPVNWLAMLATLLGFGIMLFAAWKGLS